MKTNLLSWFFVVSLVFLVMGCTPASGDSLGTLRENRNLWTDQKINDYRYQLKVSCFCPAEVTNPVTIEVRQGDSVSWKYVQTGQDADRKYFINAESINRLFQTIEDAFKQKADEITVSYDQRLGYPVRVYIDQKKNVVDEEIAYEISNFEEITPSQ
jgi:hypothetical protein